MLHATHLITYGYFGVLHISNVKKILAKKQKDLRLSWPPVVSLTDMFTLQNRNVFLLAKC